MLIFYLIASPIVISTLSFCLSLSSGHNLFHQYAFQFTRKPQSLDETTGYLSLDPNPELDRWIKKQAPISIQYMLDNIGGQGGKAVPGAARGAVIASPSRHLPNYFYQWVRDAGISMHVFVNIYAETGDEYYAQIIEDYITMSRKLQVTPNPSGNFYTGGLGEPKFEADGSAFEGSWGRPQRDGPALRAITLIKYVDARVKHGKSSKGDDADLYETIKADLEYVSNSWALSGFDLWEEVSGLHFFTASVQRRALVLGAEIADDFNDSGASYWYNMQARTMYTFITSFWIDSKAHLIETLHTPRSGLDCAIFLGVIHGDEDDEPIHPYRPDSPEILASLAAFLTEMKKRFPINNDPKAYAPIYGVSVGRYPEDAYDGVGRTGGNPWFLCTATVAELLYKALYNLLIQDQDLTVTPLSMKFYWPFINNNDDGSDQDLVIKKWSNDFNNTVKGIFQYAESFIDIIKIHTDEHGGLSEQFDGVTGFQRGARLLTWSFQSLLSAIRHRQKLCDLVDGI